MPFSLIITEYLVLISIAMIFHAPIVSKIHLETGLVNSGLFHPNPVLFIDVITAIVEAFI